MWVTRNPKTWLPPSLPPDTSIAHTWSPRFVSLISLHLYSLHTRYKDYSRTVQLYLGKVLDVRGSEYLNICTVLSRTYVSEWTQVPFIHTLTGELGVDRLFTGMEEWLEHSICGVAAEVISRLK